MPRCWLPLPSPTGCDSIVTLTLTVAPVLTESISATICEGTSYNFNGDTLMISGIYVDTLPSPTGCDNVVTLTLTVVPVLTESISATICEGASYNFNGDTLMIGGNYTDTLPSPTGCDSIVTLTLTVAPVLSSSVSATICEGTSYNFNGDTLMTGGVYTDTLPSPTGCDSVVTLTLLFFRAVHF